MFFWCFVVFTISKTHNYSNTKEVLYVKIAYFCDIKAIVMFKLLAIRPLEGCAPHIQKCLKTGMMYYLCNDYIIEPNSHIRRRSKNIEPLEENFFSVPFTNDYNNKKDDKKTMPPTVSVSAIVGKNGDGKSTLVELMMRLINNCAISYKLCVSSDNFNEKNNDNAEVHYNLRKVTGVKAELYYMVDKVVYRMAEEKDDEKKEERTRIWRIADLKEESMPWKIIPNEIQSIDDDPKCFFFTIVSNYSHYAYNVDDYENEWEVLGGEKDDNEKCWLHYIFHKYDGYLAPITLLPSRDRGNIDINTEKTLSKQRLLSLFLDADNPSDNPLSFRRVNGKDANILQLTEVAESKLQKKSIVEYFEKTKGDDKFVDLLDNIDLLEDEMIKKSLFYTSENVVLGYNSLVEYILSRFVKPIDRIINQDNDFVSFADGIVRWFNSMNKNGKTKKDGDIIAVIKKYENLFNNNDTYIQITECNHEAKKRIENGEYELALDQYRKALDISRSKLGEVHIFTAMIYNDIAVLYEQLGKYEEAVEYYNKALEIKKSPLTNDILTVAKTYINLAGTYRAKNDNPTALECCQDALRIMEPLIDVNPLLLAKAYNNTALVHEDLGNYDEALKFYYKALNCRTSLLGKDHTDVASTYYNIARVHKLNGKVDDALENYKNALKTSQKILGEYHLDTAKIYNNMAAIYEAKDEYGEARRYYNRVIEIKEKVLSSQHIDTAFSYDNLARVYEDIGELEEALKLYSKSLGIKQEILGINHVEIAISYSNLARVHYGKNELAKSLMDYDNALNIIKKTHNSSYIATTYNNAAGVCVVNGYKTYHKAERYFKEAEKKREATLGKNHSDTATTYNNMGLLYLKMHYYAKANDYFSKAFEIRKKLDGKDRLNASATCNNMAILYKAQDNHDKALKYYKEALKIQGNSGTENLDTAMYYSKIGWEYYFSDKRIKALEFFLHVLKIRKKILGAEHPDTVKYYKVIAGLYMEIGDYDKALDYHKLALGKNGFDIDNKKLDADSIQSMVQGVHYDKDLDQYENDELIKQLKPENKQNEYHSEKEKMDKIWEINHEMERIVKKIKKQELINIDKYKFLKIINAAQLGRLDTLFRIIKAYNSASKEVIKKIDIKIVTKDYSKLSLKEKCQHYIIYKICSIISKYPQYQKAQKKDSDESIREFGTALEGCVQDILNDNHSHITRKLRQVKNFMDEGFRNNSGLYHRLVPLEEKENEPLLVKIDKLKEHYNGKSISLDNLPPPIYNWDVLFQKKEDPNCIIEFNSFSSGEKQLIYSTGAIIYHLQNLANSSSRVKYYNVNLIMEEIELYYHPEYQRLYFNRLLDLIKRAKLENIQNINFVFVTHSPFILSDIPKCNVLFLKEGVPDDEMQENTFGANIHSLLKHGFFMPNLPIGEFAYEKINNLFKKLNSGDFTNNNDEKRKEELAAIYQQILLVGEPFLRNQLLLLYNAFKGSK